MVSLRLFHVGRIHLPGCISDKSFPHRVNRVQKVARTRDVRACARARERINFLKYFWPATLSWIASASEHSLAISVKTAILLLICICACNKCFSFVSKLKNASFNIPLACSLSFHFAQVKAIARDVTYTDIFVSFNYFLIYRAKIFAVLGIVSWETK